MTDPRTADIRTIHVLRRDLALADDSYRAMVWRASNGRTDTSRDLDAGERRALIVRLRELGAGTRRRPKRRQMPIAPSPQLRMCQGMWVELWKGGVALDRTDAALAAFIKRQTGVEIGRLTPKQWTSVIEALKAIAARHGMLSPDGTVLASLAVETTPEAAAARERIAELWAALAAAGKVRNGRRAALDRWLQRITGRYCGLELAAPGELREAERQLTRWLGEA